MAARAIDILSPAPVKKVLKRARLSPLNDTVKRKLKLDLSTATSSSSSMDMDMNIDSVEDQDLPEVTSIGTYVSSYIYLSIIPRPIFL